MEFGTTWLNCLYFDGEEKCVLISSANAQVLDSDVVSVIV
jgi:hypothetical protein